MAEDVFLQLKRSRVAFIGLLVFLCTLWCYYLNLIKEIPLFYPYLYYIPILFGGYYYFVVGGLVVAVASSVFYLTIVYASADFSAGFGGQELFLRIGSFNLVGLLVGFLSGRNERTLQNLQRTYINILGTLGSALDARDHYTRDHSERVAKLAVAIGKELGLPPRRLQNLEWAAKLHDLGKIGILDEMLRKVDEMTEGDLEEVKSHVIKGVEILEPLKFLDEVTRIIRHHHEWFNGQGYPDGVTGKEIELGARIIAVADVFDAMTTDRPYRKALHYEETIRKIKEGSKTQFDPQVVETFLRTVEGGKILI